MSSSLYFYEINFWDLFSGIWLLDVEKLKIMLKILGIKKENVEKCVESVEN